MRSAPTAENGPLPYDAIYSIARKRNVPVLVDAAAELLTVPNVHLQRGATLVGYSGGKCIRGPQCAGLLLGRKDLVTAAWVHSAPHHGYARSMKLGKEEAVGMLMAVEMWMKRNHKAEMAQWISWLNNIAGRVDKIQGVSTSIREPKELSNHSPGLSITWDPARARMRSVALPAVAFGLSRSGNSVRSCEGAPTTCSARSLPPSSRRTIKPGPVPLSQSDQRKASPALTE